MQCKDIPDIPVIRFIASLGGGGATWFTNEDGEQMGYNSVLNAMPKGTPEKLALAKMRMLVRRGLVKGCTCGCRGDFVLTKNGKAFLILNSTDLETTPNL